MLIVCSDNHWKTSESLWQYYRDETNATTTKCESLTAKAKIRGNSLDNRNTKNVEIAVPSKYLSNFWRTLKMLLINDEINLILTWSTECVISGATGEQHSQ